MTDQPHTDAGVPPPIATLQARVAELEAQVAGLEHMRTLLRQEHSFRSGVIERAAEGICVCHGIEDHPFVRFTVWNARMQEITGYSMADINRLGWYQTMYPDPVVQERARQRMAAMREGHDLRHERWEVSCADGGRKIVGISTSVLTTDDGLTHVLALMLDVTNEERYRQQLERHVARLEGILPICASCKKIRDSSGEWQALEDYVAGHSKVEFMHGLCAACIARLYPDLDAEDEASAVGGA